MAAMTILEYTKKNSGTILNDTVVEIYAETSDILMELPFKNIPGGSYRYVREDTLPGVAFRGVNESYVPTTQVLNPETEHLSIAGGDVVIDTALIKMDGGERQDSEREAKIKALAHQYTNKFIKGDSVADGREFDGLQRRLTGRQVISNGATSGGDPLSLAKLDEAIDAVDDPTHLYMSKAIRRRMTAASRNIDVGGHIMFEQDQFGRKQTVYAGLPILLSDRNGTQDATLQFDEAATGGGSTATSLYVLELREGKLFGLQNGGIETRSLGESHESPVLVDRIEWLAGLALEHPRAAARLRDISNAAVTV